MANLKRWNGKDGGLEDLHLLQKKVENQDDSGQNSDEQEDEVEAVDDLAQPFHLQPEVIAERDQEGDHDQGAQRVEDHEFEGLHPHCSGSEKGGDPETGDEAGDENGFAAMVPEELANAVEAPFGKHLVKAAVGENPVSPFAPDGIHGEVAGQDPGKNDGEGRIEADEAEVGEKPSGHEGDLFRDGEAQSTEEEDQEKAGIDKGFGVIYKKDGQVRQGSVIPLQPIILRKREACRLPETALLLRGVPPSDLWFGGHFLRLWLFPLSREPGTGVPIFSSTHRISL